jgi:phage regulator Rha-like protein
MKLIDLTMSTLEIAELTGKEHKHVLRDVREMLAKLDRPNFGPISYPARRKTSSFRTGKEHFHVLRDAREMLEKLGQSNFGLANYTDSQRKTRTC